MSTVLPAYALDAAVPSYSSLLPAHESTLAYNVLRSRGYQTHRTWRHLKLSLTSLDLVYGHDELINGHLEFSEPQNVLSVVIKLTGTLELTGHEIGGLITTFLTQSQTLHAQKTSHCPYTLPFALRIPSSYRHNDDKDDRPLPPSVEYLFDDIPVPALLAKCTYELVVEVVRRRLGWVGLPETRSFTLPITYKPRSRAPVPLLPVREWTRLEDTIDGGIRSVFTVPTSRIIGINDTIPFSLHLSSLPSSTLLSTLLSQSTSPVAPPTSKPKKHFKQDEPEWTGPRTRVYVIRQLLVEYTHIGMKHSTSREIVLGEAEFSSRITSGEGDTLEYECQGEVKLVKGKDSLVPSVGFVKGEFVIKDFLVLSILSPAGGEFKREYAVRLVTDSN